MSSSTLPRPAFALAALVALGCGGAGRVDANDAVDVHVELRAETFVLPNGLAVALHPDPAERAAYVHVRYDVGSKDDPRGRAGLAHLFEHLMFGAPRHGGGRDYHEWLDEIGADLNATTSRDVTSYFELIPPSELPRALWLEADRMAYPTSTLDEPSLGRERDVVKNEWRERYENEAYGHVWATTYREVFGADHPYGLPPIGVPEQLDAVTMEDVRAFARTYYRPNNATLVVCGAFDPAIAKKLVTKYFATIPPGAPIASRTFPAPAIRASRTVELAADVPAPMLVFAWRAPPIHGAGWEALHYGVSLVSGQARRRLVVRTKIADDVDGEVTDGRLGSLAVVTVRLKPGASVDDASSEIEYSLGIVSRLGDDPYMIDSFGDLRTLFMVERIARLERVEKRADALLHGMDLHGAPDAVQQDLRRWQAVAPRDVGSTVRQVLVDAPRVAVVVTPTRGAPRAGRPVR